MGIKLRIDIEKPYGNHTFIRMLISKFVENYFPNAPIFAGYLSHLKAFLMYLNKKQVVGVLFHRLNNLPDSETRQLIFEGKHKVGLHFENSKSLGTLHKELLNFKEKMGAFPELISKHGSGIYKLGKYHYPLYEPEKYKEWAKELGVRFPCGNGIPENRNDMIPNYDYYEHVFWMEKGYRNSNYCCIGDIIDLAQIHDIVILIHPESFFRDKNLRDEFDRLVSQAKEKNIEWKFL